MAIETLLARGAENVADGWRFASPEIDMRLGGFAGAALENTADVLPAGVERLVSMPLAGRR